MKDKEGGWLKPKRIDADIAIIRKTFIVGELSFPMKDSTSGNILKTNGDGRLFFDNEASLSEQIGSGEKRTGTDAGELNQLSLTDDYLYICVRGGVIGVAIWKKTLLFQT